MLTVARQCIGKILVHRTTEGETAGRIVEAEAYRGPLDLAAHSARGLTKRTTAMFGPPGHAYIYLLYGVCWAMNLVAASEGKPHAVLIRAIEPVRGIELMARRRSQFPGSRELTNGPGKLTDAMAITGADYGRDLCGDELFLEGIATTKFLASRSAGRHVSMLTTQGNGPCFRGDFTSAGIGMYRYGLAIEP